MIRLLILADDFTGALDTGVQLAKKGARTRVMTKLEEAQEGILDESLDVLVIDTESRHLSASAAYDKVYAIARLAVEAGVEYLYKKTDSAMRGNVGAELKALIEASGEERLPFLPALPGMNRFVKEGTLYIDSVPVQDSVFGKDPFEPVRYSRVTDILRNNMEVSAKSFQTLPSEEELREETGILIFDGARPEELREQGAFLKSCGMLHILAGCAGFGEMLPELLNIGSGEGRPLPDFSDQLLVYCGSLNPITRRQLSIGERAGFYRSLLPAEELLTEEYEKSEAARKQLGKVREILEENPWVILDAAYDELTKKLSGDCKESWRFRIADSLGGFFRLILENCSIQNVLITGGDTLLSCMEKVGIAALDPIGEVSAGVVVSGFSYHGKSYYVISKSGGFGVPELLPAITAKKRKA